MAKQPPKKKQPPKNVLTAQERLTVSAGNVRAKRAKDITKGLDVLNSGKERTEEPESAGLKTMRELREIDSMRAAKKTEKPSGVMPGWGEGADASTPLPPRNDIAQREANKAAESFLVSASRGDTVGMETSRRASHKLSSRGYFPQTTVKNKDGQSQLKISGQPCATAGCKTTELQEDGMCESCWGKAAEKAKKGERLQTVDSVSLRTEQRKGAAAKAAQINPSKIA